MEETGVPGENHRLTPSHWQLSHIPGRDSNPGSGEEQLALSGGALDQTAIRAGPTLELMEFGYVIEVLQG